MHRDDICQETGGRDVAFHRDLSYVSRITVDICPCTMSEACELCRCRDLSMRSPPPRCTFVDSLSDGYFDYIDFRDCLESFAILAALEKMFTNEFDNFKYSLEYC